MGKPLPKEIPSDQCPAGYNGEICYPHQEEVVVLFPGWCWGEVEAYQELKRLGDKIRSGKAGPEAIEETNKWMDQLCEFLSHRIVSWTWTDRRGRPLPQPDGTAGPLKALTSEEIVWLMTAGDTSAEQPEPKPEN